jgi:hypothetical protein
MFILFKFLLYLKLLQNFFPEFIHKFFNLEKKNFKKSKYFHEKKFKKVN